MGLVGEVLGEALLHFTCFAVCCLFELVIHPVCNY